MSPSYLGVDQRFSSATALLRSIRMAPFTVDRFTAGPPSPSLPSRFCPMGKCFFAWSAKSLLMPPVSVCAETFALFSGGRATVTLPLTDLSETDFFSYLVEVLLFLPAFD